MKDMIANFFYGKPTSVGVMFAKQKQLKEVPNAMLALAAAAVGFSLPSNPFQLTSLNPLATQLHYGIRIWSTQKRSVLTCSRQDYFRRH
jgi:hypothetical protein